MQESAFCAPRGDLLWEKSFYSVTVDEICTRVANSGLGRINFVFVEARNLA